MQATQENIGSNTATAGNKFLTFRLGNEEYGISVIAVEEIYGFDTITMTGDAPEFIKGRSVIKLGGMMVPVVDVRPKLRLVGPEYQRFTTVIVLNLSGRIIGMAVDGVTEIMTISPEQIKPVSDFAANLDTRYILGLGAVNGRTLVLVDAAKLMVDYDVAPDSDAVTPEVVQFLTCLWLRL
ncbi:MAG: chemotaxis protein CheW [Pseudomonadota bacterium]